MKVIIAGSRGIQSRAAVMIAFRTFTKRRRNQVTDIISGDAEGPDRIGIWIAEYYGINLILMPAEWELYGKRAGFLRNTEMGKIADGVVIVWDGVSKGTRHMLDYAKKNNLDYEVYDRNGRRRREWE